MSHVPGFATGERGLLIGWRIKLKPVFDSCGGSLTGLW